MKSKIYLAIWSLFVFVCFSNAALAQLHIGISYSTYWTKGSISEKSANAQLFSNNTTRSIATNYSIGYSLKNKWKFAFDLQTIKYSLNVSPKLGNKSAFQYAPGTYIIPNLNAHYLFGPSTHPKLKLSVGAGLGVFCSTCTKKSKPYYPKFSSTTKSYPFYYLEGIYFNNWESSYRKKYIITGNLYLGVYYTLWNFHVFGIEGQISKGNNWSNQHVIRYENNGITPGNDQYENDYIILQQRHLMWAINLKYELKLNSIPWLWKKHIHGSKP